jgi:hypothetical protein
LRIFYAINFSLLNEAEALHIALQYKSSELAKQLLFFIMLFAYGLPAKQ